MVLGLIVATPSTSTCERWHAEIQTAELHHDGMVHRSGRWLQRRVRMCEATWLASSTADEERRQRSQMGPEARRIHAALHHGEQTAPDQKILKRAPLAERIERLCAERLRSSLGPIAAAQIDLLDERRRDALLRPCKEAMLTSIAEEQSRSAPVALTASALEAATAPPPADDNVRAEADWEEACQALAEEWQLSIATLLEVEFHHAMEHAAAQYTQAVAAHEANAQAAAAAATGGSPPSPPAAGAAVASPEATPEATPEAAAAATRVQASVRGRQTRTRLAGDAGDASGGGAPARPPTAPAPDEAGALAPAPDEAPAAAPVPPTELEVQRAVDADPASLAHLLAALSGRELRQSARFVHDSVSLWLRELCALAQWSPHELDAWCELSEPERAAVVHSA